MLQPEKLRNEESHNLNYSTNIIRVTKSGQMRCDGSIAHMEGSEKLTTSEREETTWDALTLMGYIKTDLNKKWV
jgi:hypothetical protein